MTEHDLEAMLTMYGPVVSTRILKDSNGTPRGVGFARYACSGNSVSSGLTRFT